jgi:hypothetical protein
VLATLLERELTTGRAVDIPPDRRLWLWQRGFTSRSHALFELTAENHHLYVSDLAHELANDAAGRWGDVVSNKLTFYLLFAAHADSFPDCYGVLDGGRFGRPAARLVDPFDGDGPLGDDPTATVDGVAWLDTYLAAHDRLVLKPVYGSGGRGVLVCERDGDGYRVNGEAYTDEAFAALLADLDEYLAWQFVEQAPYAAGLYPDATNTLRVLTLWDEAADAPFVAGAVHRVGTDRSAPVDNWSRGGLSALVRDDNTLSRAAQWRPEEGQVHWFDDHPDTGRTLTGATVPDWPAVRERVLELATTVPYLPRMGWDVVVTDDGIAVLEVNAHAATRTIQVHRPLLDDPRVRRFYERHARL